MAVYDQVIGVFRKLGRWATFDEILKKLEQRGAKIPKKSLRMYISSYYKRRKLKKNPIKVKKYNGKTYYMLAESIPHSNSHKNVGNTKKTNDNKLSPEDDKNDKSIENGLYLIILSSAIAKTVGNPGSLFKIGSSENITKRIKNYNQGFPVEIIRHIHTFRVPININLEKIEKKLRKKLLSSNDLKINKYISGNQNEWLQTTSFNLNEETHQLVSKIEDIFNDIKGEF